MKNNRTTVTVTLKAKPGQEQRLREVLANLIEPSRDEDGCLNYFMHQSLDDAQSFMLYMYWRDEEAFDRHVRTPWVQDFDTSQAKDLLAEPYILTRWQYLG
jgi:quinol monooxygenase YgiN